MDANDFDELYRITFASDFAGYTPSVAEIPNGDGKVDAQKRYAHVNTRTIPSARRLADRQTLWAFFNQFIDDACSEAERLGILIDPWVSPEDSTLRLLEYPIGVGGAEHTDFDLFTLNLYRSHPDLLVPGKMEVHYGELAEIVTGGRLKATPHHVIAHPTQTQRSAVFFVMPKLDAVLPTGVVVRDWLKERKERSRVRM